MRSTKQPVTSITAPFRRPSIKAGGCLAIAAVLTLSACGPTPAEPLPTPDNSAAAAAPVFASDEEALAAVTSAYAAYVEAADVASASGGYTIEQLEPLITADYLVITRDDYAELSEMGVSTVGETSFDTIDLQSQTVDGEGNSEVVIYLCLDVTNVRLIDARGSDVTPADRRNRLPLEVTFKASPTPLLDRSDLWTGANFC